MKEYIRSWLTLDPLLLCDNWLIHLKSETHRGLSLQRSSSVFGYFVQWNQSDLDERKCVWLPQFDCNTELYCCIVLRSSIMVALNYIFSNTYNVKAVKSYLVLLKWSTVFFLFCSIWVSLDEILSQLIYSNYFFLIFITSSTDDGRSW